MHTGLGRSQVSILNLTLMAWLIDCAWRLLLGLCGWHLWLGRGFDKLWELDCSNSCVRIVSFHLNLDFLWVFEVVYNDLSSTIGSHCDGVSIRTERYTVQMLANLDLFYLLPLHNVIEEDLVVQSRAAKQKIINRWESHTRANVSMWIEFVSQRIALFLIQFLGVSIALSSLHDGLEVPDADDSTLIGGCEDMSLGLTEFSHCDWRADRSVPEDTLSWWSIRTIWVVDRVHYELSIRGSWRQESIITIERHWVDRIRTVMIIDDYLDTLLLDIHNAHWGIITAICYLRALRWEAQIRDRDTSRTQLHDLYHCAIRCSRHCQGIIVLPARCYHWIVVWPGKGWYWVALMRVTDHCLRDGIFEAMYEHSCRCRGNRVFLALLGHIVLWCSLYFLWVACCRLAPIVADHVLTWSASIHLGRHFNLHFKLN